MCAVLSAEFLLHYARQCTPLYAGLAVAGTVVCFLYFGFRVNGTYKADKEVSLKRR